MSVFEGFGPSLLHFILEPGDTEVTDATFPETYLVKSSTVPHIGEKVELEDSLVLNGHEGIYKVTEVEYIPGPHEYSAGEEERMKKIPAMDLEKCYITMERIEMG